MTLAAPHCRSTTRDTQPPNGEVGRIGAGFPLPGIQNQADERDITIEQVGVSGLRYPITVIDQADEIQWTNATLNLSAGLPHDAKGTHMSRFIWVLEWHRGEITIRTPPAVLADMRETLGAQSARIEAHFPHFLERQAPVNRA